MSSAAIRVLQQDDLDPFYDVMEAVAAEGLWIASEPPIDRAGLRADALRQIEAGTGVFLVAVLSGRIVGGLGMHQVIPGLYDLGMMILREHRGRGIGTVLMTRCLEIARERSAYKLTLQVWPHNAAAIGLYEKFGFEREGYLKHQWRRKNGEIWDAVVMGLVLED